MNREVLNLKYYKGSDLYSDGAVEDQILEALEAGKTAEQLLKDNSDWAVLYHLSDIRHNLLEWYDFKQEGTLLEIGSGCGALTGLFCEKVSQVTCIELSQKRSRINAVRNHAYDNFEIMVGNFQDIEVSLTEKYDYITLIGVFEYSEGYIGTHQPYVEMLRRISRHLEKDGKLVIAIENRLGLKYWAGCTEDHVGKYFEGIENYPDTKGVRTFSRKELQELIDAAGSFQTTFYYPYPDYKFPLTIYSDKRLPKKGELKDNFCNFDRPRIQLFNEERVYDSLVDAGLFPEFSNSFLVIAKREEE